MDIFDLIGFIAVIIIFRYVLISIFEKSGDKYLKNENWERAVKNFKKALFLSPRNVDILNKTGNACAENQESTSAIDYYKKALILDPNHYEAHNNLALTYLDIGDTDTAKKHFFQAGRIKRGIPFNEGNENILSYKTPENIKLITGKHKIKHDIEQLQFLIKNNVIPKHFKKLTDDYNQVFDEIKTSESFLTELSEKQKNMLESTYLRNFYIDPGKSLNSSAINPEINFDKLQSEFITNKENDFDMVYIDNFLTPEALSALQKFCWSSTFWNDFSRNRGYLAAYIDDGFCSDLLLQIAKEAKQRFPLIFQDLPLLNMWSFKCDSSMQGVLTHADEAAVNINLWIAPDDANLDPESGGLAVYNKKAPKDWSHKDYNSNTKLINEYLSKNNAQKVVIPYRQNRAIIFNSVLFHETDNFNFKEGYENRRINVTFLFGRRKT